jgi:carboxyl-terminal processing protease
VKLVRAMIRIQSVRSRMEDDSIGYIRITTFDTTTDVELNNAMKNLKQQAGNKLAAIVLDLRNNPGGLFDQAVAVSDAFLERGEIVSTRGQHADDAKRYTARPGDITGGLAMVVLINGGSASASEIVAGALQDQQRAILLGTRSFGKGSVQTIISLPGHGAMRLMTARYYTPSGHSIQAKGIDPDIVVEAAKIEHPVGDAGASGRKNDDGEDNAGDHATVDPAVIGTADDYQLARAVDMLHGIALFNARVQN